MSDLTSQVLAALITAPDELKQQALDVLKGIPVSAPSTKPEPFLTLAELGRQLNISACSLARWKIPRYPLGGQAKYIASEVVAYLKGVEFNHVSKELKRQRAIKTADQARRSSGNENQEE